MPKIESTGINGKILANRRERSEQLRIILYGAPAYPNLFEGDTRRIVRKWVVFEGKPWPKTAITDGTYPYIASQTGELRIPRTSLRAQLVHHHELANGGDVIAAGLLRIRDSRIVYLDNDSTHYEPDPSCINIAILLMKLWGVPLAHDLKRGLRIE